MGYDAPLELNHKPASGDNRSALTVTHRGSSGTALTVRGASTLLDLKNEAGTSMLAVSNAGTLSGSALTLTSPTLTTPTLTTPAATGATLSTVVTVTYAPVTLTDAATIATNAALGTYFRCAAVAGNRSLGAPTNPVDTQNCWWEFTASGAQRTVTLVETAGGFLLSDIVTSEVMTIPQDKIGLLNAVYSATATKWIVISTRICE